MRTFLYKKVRGIGDSYSLYIWNKGSSQLIYRQLGAWFQIYRELEDHGKDDDQNSTLCQQPVSWNVVIGWEKSHHAHPLPWDEQPHPIPWIYQAKVLPQVVLNVFAISGVVSWGTKKRTCFRNMTCLIQDVNLPNWGRMTTFTTNMETWAKAPKLLAKENLPWKPTTIIFRGYNPYLGGFKPSFLMVLGMDLRSHSLPFPISNPTRGKRFNELDASPQTLFTG